LLPPDALSNAGQASQESVRQDLKAGEINIDVRTSHSERVSAIIRVVLIAAGTALTMAGAHAGSRKIEDQSRGVLWKEKRAPSEK
jgi:hypothetical protein